MKNICVLMNSKKYPDRLDRIKKAFNNIKGVKTVFFDKIKTKNGNIKWNDHDLLLLHETDVQNEDLIFYNTIKEYRGTKIYFSGGIPGAEISGENSYDINSLILLDNIGVITDQLINGSEINITELLKTSKSKGTDISSAISTHRKLNSAEFEDIISLLKTIKNKKIFLIDDDIPDNLTEISAELVIQNSFEEGLNCVKDNKFDLALIDHDLSSSKGNGLDIKKALNKNSKAILLTGIDDFFTVYEALQSGINHFISKENFSIEYLKRNIELLDIDTAPLVTGKSPGTLKMFEYISFFSDLDDDVLITGENGTGKELVASTLYHLRNYKGGFIAKNCAGIPETLFESEMFGYREGSFTGALKGGRSSPFEDAENGILFLDEIGELPVSQQVKLLRVIQERQINPLGLNRSVRFKTRLLFATNKDMNKEILNGNLRQDLFYRISGFEIVVPPLRERKQDIEMLSAYFTHKFKIKNRNVDIRLKSIDRSSMRKLKEYFFPGNIRELEKIINRSLLKMIMDKNNNLEFIIPGNEEPETEPENIKTDVISVEDILKLLTTGIITAKGLKDSIKRKIISHLKKSGETTKDISRIFDMSEQSFRNLCSRLNADEN